MYLDAVIYAGAVWPIVLVAGWHAPWLKKGRIAEWKWIWFYGLYTTLLIVGLVIHYFWLAPEHPPLQAMRARDGIGWRASLDLSPLEVWLFLGAGMSLGAALRGYLKPGYWLGPARK
jgi:hypothetical protein